MFSTNLFKKKKVQTKTNAGKLCECSGEIEMLNTKEVEYFPLVGGYHTAFLVGKCSLCDGLAGFPHSNLEIAVEEGTEEGKRILRENFGLCEEAL